MNLQRGRGIVQLRQSAPVGCCARPLNRVLASAGRLQAAATSDANATGVRAVRAQIDDSYALSSSSIEYYQQNGFVRLTGVFSSEALSYYEPAITEEVDRAEKVSLEDDEAYAKAFTQVMNLFEVNNKVKEFVLGRRLGKIASELMQVKARNFQVVGGAFELGEVSFHSGWVFHRAGANTTSTQRKVMTIIFMDEDMVMAEPRNANQLLDQQRFLPGVLPGHLCASFRNPVVWSSSMGP